MKHLLPGPTTRGLCALGLFVLVIATACASPSGPTGGNGGGDPRGQTATIIAAGDIGMCGRPSVAQVAQLVATLPGELVLAGDIAYFQGTAEQFRDCFNPSWGAFRSRWHAVPGNHEYESPGAHPY
ncbi:MAG TPA: metallophosphoesterase family protein, partial [Vicinamibacterales bacterium]|nr:metallophosphoesterase family protein [Vicinamibacterales bacterium]